MCAQATPVRLDLPYRPPSGPLDELDREVRLHLHRRGTRHPVMLRRWGRRFARITEACHVKAAKSASCPRCTDRPPALAHADLVPLDEDRRISRALQLPAAGDAAGGIRGGDDELDAGGMGA